MRLRLMPSRDRADGLVWDSPVVVGGSLAYRVRVWQALRREGDVPTQMLLTLSVNSLKPLLNSGKSRLSFLDIPRYTRDELGLHGLNVQTSYLAGWELPQIDRLRDEGDKAGCPCLLLIEDEPQKLGHPSDACGEAAVERMDRVLRVAHRLGCSGVALSVADPTPPATIDLVAERLKSVVAKAERLEMNLLLIPRPGVLEAPEALTGLIRKVGGFRIGSFPDFQAAAATNDLATYLRALTPYASAVCASSQGFSKAGEHEGYDLKACVTAITSVGYDGTISVEYRGKGDPTSAVLATRELIESVVEEAEPPPEEE